MRESQVEKHLVKRVEETGGLIRKIAYIGRRACPDRLVGWPTDERFCQPRKALVETKRPGGKARGEQEREHERLRAVGFHVYVLDTIEGVDKFIEDMTT